MLNLDHTDIPAFSEYATVYVVFELSKAHWRLGVMIPGSRKMSRFSVPGGDSEALSALFAKIRSVLASRCAFCPATKRGLTRIGFTAG